MDAAREVGGRLCIFHPPGRMGLGPNVFGKDVANFQLYRALVQHGGYEQVDILSIKHITDAEAADDLLTAAASATRVGAYSILAPGPPIAAGALLRGQPDLEDLGWLRRHSAGDRGYSLVGLAHTLAPLAVRQYIARSLTAPIFPWDAIVCTSPSVRQGLETMFDNWGDFLAERTGGAPPPRMALPIVPLGVNAGALAATADRPAARARLRAELALADDDVLVIWVGRLSWFEKAFPQPMFQAVQQAASKAKVKVSFAMAGWFPSEGDRHRYEEAARLHAPDVDVRFLDGNDQAVVGDLWAAGDVFLSLVDNIQETFGITPVEAMAAGLPVVASDWDGYRSTVRHGVDGFLIPTLGGPPGGLGAAMSLRHAMKLDSYQVYVGRVAQHTAVHIGRCAEALGTLIAQPDLRRKMGAAGRERVRDAFDWPVVARQMRGVFDELSEIRRSAAEVETRRRLDPVRGDPFADFAHFPTHALSLDLRISSVAGKDGTKLRALAGLDLAFQEWRGSPDEAVQALDLLATGEAMTVRDVLLAFPVNRRRAVEFSLLWLAKYGFVDWMTQA